MIPTSLPQLRLDVDALDRNIDRMTAWCAGHGAALAPHVKTTMSPQIVARQLAAGARGVTVAATHQAVLAARWGATEILIANEVVGAARLRTLRDDPDLARATVRILVDSAEGVARAAEVFAGREDRPLGILIDVGTPTRGRTGVRTKAEALALADAVAAAPGLRLDGVAGYEGVVPNERSGDVVDAVDAHCRFVAEVFDAVRPRIGADEPIFSMGGSAFPDRVVAALPADRDGVLVLLRSGCYVTHDHGTYAGVSPIAGLEPALSVAALVTSRPEPGLAVLNAGKRDLPYDAGLPVVLGARRDGDPVDDVDPDTVAVRNLYDHHAVLTGVPAGLRIGDVVDLGISHPCSAFDRWPEYLALGAGAPPRVWTTDFRRDPG
ncbi:alanine racemase [Pseudonocardia alni]|uniref:alanine racemase n=1 Tax=Pseudonocardia alni TaxID=33907 RepID=UPI0033FFA213